MDKSYIREEILKISGVDPKKCMRCGKCSATCPAYESMEYHPHQFVKMVDDGEVELLLSSDSLYKCLSCYACIDRCPRSVEPAKLVEAVRAIATRRKGADRLTPDSIASIINDEIPQQALVSAFRKYRK